MDAAEILARFARAREFTAATANSWQFTLRMPTEFHERRLYAEAQSASGSAAPQLWMHAMLVDAIVGWSGPTVGDLLGDGDATPLPFAPSLVPALIDANLAVFDALTLALHNERQARAAKVESAAKNSASA